MKDADDMIDIAWLLWHALVIVTTAVGIFAIGAIVLLIAGAFGIYLS